MLLGLEPQDAGVIEQGKTVVFGYYQQKDVEFPEEKRVIDVIRDQNEYLHLANGEKLSASQLLERFLFPASQQYRFAHSLSGGEKRRLYLLKVLMSNPNFLILDEPTNDLDLLTLRVLEDFLLQFQGCLLIVSHDRSFMDRLVDHLFVFEGEGKISDFRGTYSEWKLQQEEQEKKKKADPEIAQPSSSYPAGDIEKPAPSKLSYNEARELEQLIKDLETLEEEKNDINRIFENKDLSYDDIALLSEHLGQIMKQIEQKEARRFELLEKQGG